MNLVPLTISFFAGFIVASVIGMTFIVPFLQDHWTRKVGSDYCVPLSVIHAEIESTAATEKSERTLAQLRVLNKRFVPYSVGGLSPYDWWDEIIAAKLPTTQPTAQPPTK